MLNIQAWRKFSSIEGTRLSTQSSQVLLLKNIKQLVDNWNSKTCKALKITTQLFILLLSRCYQLCWIRRDII